MSKLVRMALGTFLLLVSANLSAHVPEECNERVIAVTDKWREMSRLRREWLETSQEIIELEASVTEASGELKEFLEAGLNLTQTNQNALVLEYMRRDQEQVALVYELLECIGA